jgi:hypothetical protein
MDKGLIRSCRSTTNSSHAWRPRNWCVTLPSSQREVYLWSRLLCFADWNFKPNIQAENGVTWFHPQRMQFKQADCSGKRQGVAVVWTKENCLISKFETIEHVGLGVISRLAKTPVLWFASDTRACLALACRKCLLLTKLHYRTYHVNITWRSVRC